MKSATEIRELTASILDKTEVDEYLANISDESISEMLNANPQEPSEEQGLATNVYYGHDMRYDGDNYLFRADIPGSPCGMKWWILPRSRWDHSFISQRCGSHNNLAVLKFTRR
jgi:hypothetical protein